MASELSQMFDELDLEFWFDRESIAHKVTHGSSGMQINAKECPYCNDRRWRVYLNAETGAGNCFVCDVKFSKSNFIHQYLGTSWANTVGHLKDVLRDQGWRPKRKSKVATENPDAIEIPASLPMPTKDGQMLVYLVERGVTAELAEYFGLRFCLDAWWNYVRDDGEKGGQNFANRVLIPIYDIDGSLVNFQGRDVIGGEERRKYLFPAGLPGTGRFLFNGQNAVRMKRVVMGEGAFDVIAMKKAFDEDTGLRDVVPIGSFGKHLSYGSLDGNDQLGRFLKLKEMGLEEVTIMWDGEASALVSAIATASKLNGLGLRVRIALLPADKDPNEATAKEVCDAFYAARLYDRMLGVAWTLRNPYKSPKAPISFDLHSV